LVDGLSHDVRDVSEEELVECNILPRMTRSTDLIRFFDGFINLILGEFLFKDFFVFFCDLREQDVVGCQEFL